MDTNVLEAIVTMENEFWKLDAYTNGYQIIVFGIPPEQEEDNPLLHNCDAMGCGSVGPHLLVRIPVMQPYPELSWVREGYTEHPPEYPEDSVDV